MLIKVKNAILTTLILSLVITLLTGCIGGSSGDIGSGESNENGENSENGDITQKKVPIYQGMSISTEKITASAMQLYSTRAGTNNGNGNSGNNGNHYGQYKGDHDGKNNNLDEDNPFPDNSEGENIENEAESSLKVDGALHDIYYAEQNQDIYIYIHISNPDSFEILSFTLNGKKYSGYMFEEGSDMETIILKYNVGDASGIVEYTIDAIKYVDGTEIKDVVIDGDKTVRAGVKRNDQVSAAISNLDIGTNALSFSVSVKDNDGLVAISGGKLYAVLYDGFEIVREQELSLGENSVYFDGLKTNTPYQYAVVGYYDDLSGKGFDINILHKDAFYTESVVLFSDINVWNDGVDFSLLWHESCANTHLTSLKLYQNDRLVKELSPDNTSVRELLSANTYTLIAEYVNQGETESIYLEFTTYEKGMPILNLTKGDITQDSIDFIITEDDAENVGSIKKIELIHKNGTTVAESSDTRAFTGLLSNNQYTVKVTYTYDLNDGNGTKNIVKELTLSTLAKATPGVSLKEENTTQSSLKFSIDEIDTDNVGKVTNIQLIHNGTVVAEGADLRECSGLLSNNQYTIKVTYTYDLCEGIGAQTIEKELTISTLAESAPSVKISGEKTTSSSISASLTIMDTKNTLVSYKTELYNGAVLVGETTDLKINFIDLDYLVDYKMITTYIYNLNDGKGNQTETIEKMIKPASSGLTYEISGSYCTITGIGSCTDTIVAIPEYINGYKVTKIGDKAFEEKANISFIYIPNTITSIGQRAFYGCTGLREITIPKSVTSIGDQVFYKANNLSTVYYNSTYTSQSNRFLDLSHITKVVFGGKTVPSYIMYNNSSVKEVTLLDSVTSIGSSAFKGCTGITSIVLPNGVTSIGSYAFEECTNLTHISIPNGVTSIGNSAFNKCAKLSGVIMPNSITSLGTGVFAECVGLAGVVIPDTITSIPYATFYNCHSLKCIVIPDSVTNIEDYAFYNVRNYNCLLVYGGDNESWNKISKGSNNSLLFTKFYYNYEYTGDDFVFISNGDGTCSLVGSFNAVNEKLIIPSKSLNGDTVTSIENDAFYQRNDIIGVVIPGTVTDIKDSAFMFCENLKRVTLNDGLINIGDLAFSCCNSLTNITIPDSVKSIGAHAFEGCWALKNVSIPEGVIEIDDYTFHWCENLTSITIPSTVSSIGDYVFYGCFNLENIYVDSNNKSFKSIDGVLYSGDGKTLIGYPPGRKDAEFTVPDGVTEIGINSFFECQNIVNVNLPESIITIGESAFSICKNLTSINLPDGIKNIGNHAFMGCESLTSVTIPSGITAISSGVFSYCGNLTEIILLDTVTNIGDFAFSSCQNLTSITIPSSVTSIGSYAFDSCKNLKNIYFEGTRAEWDAITKGNRWNYSMGSYTIHYSEE